MKQRILRILIAFDILAFALLTLGNSHRNETISAAAWSMYSDDKLLGNIFRPLIDFLFYPIQKEHCFRAWLEEHKTYGN